MINQLHRRLIEFPWHCFLFAIYYPLQLLSINLGEVDISAANRAVVIGILGTILVLIGFGFLIRDWIKAGYLASLWLNAFFLYGPVFNLLAGWQIGVFIIGRHSIFLPIWLLLFVFLSFLIIKRIKTSPIIGRGLTLISLFLLLFPTVRILSQLYHVYRVQSRDPLLAPLPNPTVQSASKPDIYFIILDMYGREDLLRSKFGLDNSLFTSELKKLGFVLPVQASSNYPGTMLSLASTLNTEYLTEVIDPRFIRQPFELTQLLQKNRMRGFLENQGYEVYAFETGYRWTEWRDAEHYFSLKDARMTDFEELLLRSSILEVLIKKGYLASQHLSGGERKYELIRKTLDDLEWISGQPGTKFVYAHVSIPHPPFVFDTLGEYSLIPIHVEGKDVFYTRDEYQKGYTDQIKFINSRILSIIKAILQNSSDPPVIILQGDHGPRYVSEEEQLMILSAYFLPGLKQPLDEDITPVNNFRVVLRQYFGLEIPILANHAYFTDESQPTGVKPITVTDP